MTAGPRIRPVTEAPPELLDLYRRNGVRTTEGRPLNLFATVAHHPAMMEPWLMLGTHVLANNTLTPRDRELLILRVGFLCRSAYEFSQHVRIARRAGVTDTEIGQVRIGPEDPAWSNDDRSLLRAVDELHDHSTIDDETWNALAARYDTQQLLDLVFTIGHYHLVAFALNACRVELDAGVPDVL
jgi:4-carboxymuconolactone decarboxylase